MIRTFTGTAVALLALIGTAPPVWAEPAEEKPAAEVSESSEKSWDIWIRADETYRLRAVRAPSGPGGLLNPAPDDETDHDVQLFLSGGLRSPCGAFGADLALGLWWDLNGTADLGETTGLGSQTDYRQPWWDVFTLAADYRSDGAIKQIRLGRQTAGHGLPVAFDGLTAEFRAAGPYLELFVLGGRTAHFFEPLMDGLFEDWIGSAGVVIRPVPFIRLELDYRMLMEDTLTTDLAAKDGDLNHSYGLTAWFKHDDWLLAKVRVRGIDSEVSHLGASGRLYHPDWQLGVDVDVDAQLATLNELGESLDPFHTLLGESLAHLRYRIDIWKIFEMDSGRYGLHLGFDGRNLLEGEAGAFNHNLGKAYFMLHVADLIVEGLFLQASVENHFIYDDNEISSDMFLTAGGAIGFENKLLRAEVGTYYQRVKYDYFADVREVNDVRTTFVAFGVRPLDYFGIRLRYEYEQFDRDVHTVVLALSQSY